MLYDLIIIGAGPAGLTASIYCLRARKKVLMLEKTSPGGQMAMTHNIENYPGFEKISGADLTTKMLEHAVKLGLCIINTDVLEYDIIGNVKKARTHIGTFEAKSILLCTGAFARQLEVENEQKYIGKGINYNSNCANKYKDKIVAVVGGGNSSIKDVLYLYDIAKKVYLIHRRDAFRCEESELDKIKILAKKSNSKVSIILNSIVTELKGNSKLESIVIENKKNKSKKEIKIDELFVAIGRMPDTDLLKDIVQLDSMSYIITDEEMKTNIPGVFAAGDVRRKTLRQIITACSDGAIASVSINNYISTINI